MQANPPRMFSSAATVRKELLNSVPGVKVLANTKPSAAITALSPPELKLGAAVIIRDCHAHCGPAGAL